MTAPARYRIPGRTVELGSLLDLHVELDASHRVRVDEWAGWLVTIPEHGFELLPGRAKIFLFAPKPAPVRDAGNLSAAERAYKRWHKRGAEELAVHTVPDHVGHYCGRVLRIGYRSDKWGPRGKTIDYDHDFTENGARAPKLYTSSSERNGSTAALIVGGDMTITERGIA